MPSVAAALSRDEAHSVDRRPVKCECGHRVFDGIVIKSRVVRLLPKGGAEALCRCRRWVMVPATYAPDNE